MPEFPAIVYEVLFVAIMGTIVWLSVRAKPLGPKPYEKPYRFATFLALTTGLLSLGYAPTAFFVIRHSTIVAGLLYAILAILCASTGILLWRRKRSGVSVFFVTYALLIMFPALVSTSEGRQETSEEAKQPGLLLPYFLVSGYYIWKRWHSFDLRAKAEDERHPV